MKIKIGIFSNGPAYPSAKAVSFLLRKSLRKSKSLTKIRVPNSGRTKNWLVREEGKCWQCLDNRGKKGEGVRCVFTDAEGQFSGLWMTHSQVVPILYMTGSVFSVFVLSLFLPWSLKTVKPLGGHKLSAVVGRRAGWHQEQSSRDRTGGTAENQSIGFLKP